MMGSAEKPSAYAPMALRRPINFSPPSCRSSADISWHIELNRQIDSENVLREDQHTCGFPNTRSGVLNGTI